MNDQTPETAKAPTKYHWGRLLAAVLIAAAFFVTCGVFNNPLKDRWDDGPKTPLDYDLVMRTPNLFVGEDAYLEGTLVQIVPTAPGVTSKDIYLLVSEKGNADHKWLVYGPFDAKKVGALQEGMDIVADGICNGAVSMTNKAGFENTFPAIAFVDLKYGDKINSDPQ